MTETLAPLRWKRSPNFSSRHGERVTHLVWHSTIGGYAGAVDWLCNPAAQASAHLVVDEHGRNATQLVRLADKAWHCATDNPWTVGVEHASLVQGFHSTDQLLQSARLFGWLCKHFDIPAVHGVGRPRGIVRHRDLGVLGGSHHDGPSDHVWFDEFLPAVRENVSVGGYRKAYAR